MELKDNFTNKYFRPENIKSQLDLINQPTGEDAMADGLMKQGSGPALGKAQRISNALATGIGSGLKASANDKRQQQIDPLLKMTGEINARAAYLEAQMQDQEKQKMTMVDFIRNNAGSLEDLGNASTQDNPKSQRIAKYLAEKLEIATGIDFGKFDYYDSASRQIFFKQPNGSTIGYSVLDPIRPFAKEALGEQAPFIMRKLDPYHEEQYKNAEELRQLALEKERAGIDQTRAHTGLYDAQAGKTMQEMNNPPLSKEQELQQKSNLKVLETAATDNFNYIKSELKPRVDANERILSVYEELDDIAKNNPDIVGSDFATKAWRSLSMKLGMDPDLDYTKLKSVEFEKMLRPLLGAQFGETEGERILSKFASIENNPESLKRFLKEEIPKTARLIKKDQKYLELYDKDRASNPFSARLEDGLDDEVTSFLQDRQSKRQQGNTNSNMVVAQDPDTGEQMMIPSEKIEEAKSRGLIINE